MPKIIRSPRSKADVFTAAQYIAEKSGSLQTAEQWLDTCRPESEVARSESEARPDLGPTTRGFPVGNYIIFYRPIEDGIELSRILHAARDIPRIFRTGEN